VSNLADQRSSGEISPWPRRAARLGRFVVGVIFLFAGVVKALHPEGFARQIDAYGWLPSAFTYGAAFLLIAVEFFLAAALLLDARPLAASLGTAGLLLLFIVASGTAWSRGMDIDCGCFGSVVERGPGEVIIEDAIMLGLLLPTFLLGRSGPGRRWRTAAAVAVAVLGVGLAVAAPRLPVDGLVTDLVPGADLEKLGMDALVPHPGAVLVALMEVEEEPGELSREMVARVNEIVLAVPELEVIGFAAAGPDERAVFGWTTGAGFLVDEVAPTMVDAMARTLPRFALLVDGRVVAVWNENPPDPGALRSAIGGTLS